MTYGALRLSGGQLVYRSVGKGPVVLVLQGGHCTQATRLGHDKLAAVGYHVLTPSRPGYDSSSVALGASAQEAAVSLAALLESEQLNTAKVAVIGVSAAAPTAVTFAAQFPDKTAALILESGHVLPWDDETKNHAKRLFGRTEALTWAALKLALRLRPQAVMTTMLAELTTQDAEEVFRALADEDKRYFRALLKSMRSHRGFLCDLEHKISAQEMQQVLAPTLIMASPNDKNVPLEHAQHALTHIRNAVYYEVNAESHLLDMGAFKGYTWHKRLEFLRTHLPLT